MTQQQLDRANDLQNTDRLMKKAHEDIVDAIEKSIKGISSGEISKQLNLSDLKQKLWNVCSSHIMPIRKSVLDEFEKL